jgi:glycosyltransferase involved in cell wall biosynthesis
MISIIIPYKEDRGWLDKAIESVEKQTYKDYEIILSQSDNRVGYNLNRGIEKARGGFIKYLCDDDLLTPNSLQDSLNGMGGYDFIHGNAINFFSDKRRTVQRPIKKYFDWRELKTRNYIHGGTLMYRSGVFEKYGLFDESLWTGEEYDFNLKIMHQGARLGYVNSTLYLYRRHEMQKSIGNMDSEYQAKRQLQIQEIKRRYV